MRFVTAARFASTVLVLITLSSAIAAGGQTRQGTVTVLVAGGRADVPLTVHIESNTGDKLVTVPADGKRSLAKEVLAFGTYHISARQVPDLVTEIKVVQLDALSPDAIIALNIGENRSSVMLTDPSGRPVRNATVRALRPTGPRFLRVGVDVRETEPGVYSLDLVRPGTPLLIRSDSFVPTCRMAPRNETVLVSLDAGRRIEVQFPRDITIAVVKELAVLSDIPGADCAVPLSAFRPEMIAAPTARHRPVR